MAVEKFIESFPAAEATTQARLRNLLRAKTAFEKAEVANSDYNLLHNATIYHQMRRR